METMEHAFIRHFVSMLGQIKLFHWATMSFAKHNALDDLHTSASAHVDRLVEAYIGRFKKQPLKHFTIETASTSDTKQLDKYLETERDALTKMAKDKTFDKAPELVNIMEEIIADLDQAIYLCKLS